MSEHMIGRRRTWVAIVATLPALIGACTVSPADSASDSQTSTSGSTAPATTTSVDASTLEQLSLERINRARLRPAEEAAANSIAIDEGVTGRLDTQPKPAVALNAALHKAAEEHSQDMLDRDYFEHDTPEGVTPFDRMTSAGYAFTRAGENLAWQGTTGALDEVAFVESQHVDLFVDAGIEDRGHRVTMLNERYREVGISIIRGTFTNNGTDFDSIMQTQDFGTSTSNSTFVLGVVYNDANGNGMYDSGEGVANSTVTLDNTSQSTNAAGGYVFEVTQVGSYTIRFATGDTQAFTLSAGSPNIKIDLVDSKDVVVNLGLGPLS